MWYFEEYDSTERRNEFKRKITEQGIMVVMQNLECRCVVAFVKILNQSLI